MSTCDVRCVVASSCSTATFSMLLPSRGQRSRQPKSPSLWKGGFAQRRDVPLHHSYEVTLTRMGPPEYSHDSAVKGRH